MTMMNGGYQTQCQTFIVDRNLSSHRLSALANVKQPPATERTRLVPAKRKNEYNRSASIADESPVATTSQPQQKRTKPQVIRFQVVVWNIGIVDVAEGRVPVTFRVTIFWNDQIDDESCEDGGDYGKGDDASTVASRYSSSWHMSGRQTAIQKEVKEIPLKTIDVPPVSILNAVTFDVIGQPDVCMLREDERLMRWTCMYRAELLQNHWNVENFPHDKHDIRLRLAILQNRTAGQQWDRRIWRLGLATSDDSQGSTAIPYGLIVSHVRVPGFTFDNRDGLVFDFVELDDSPGGMRTREVCLEAKLTVLRNSSYYDKNIMPLFALLNLAAVCMLALSPKVLFQRGLLLLNISFVEVNLRMTTDKHLPSVSYQIKMQRIMNEYFCVLLLLVIESTIVYLMKLHGVPTLWLEIIAVMSALSHNISTLYRYYRDADCAKRSLSKGTILI